MIVGVRRVVLEYFWDLALYLPLRVGSLYAVPGGFLSTGFFGFLGLLTG